MNDSQNETEKHTRDFLLNEHRYFAESFWKNEETGEKRVTFFITLITAVISALVVLLTVHGADVPLGVIIGLPQQGNCSHNRIRIRLI